MKNGSVRLYTCVGLAAAVVLALAAPAHAQYRPRPLNDPATGELFHIEGGAGFWNPSSTILVASGGSGALSGIPGTQIDAKRDLGFTDSRRANLLARAVSTHQPSDSAGSVEWRGSRTQPPEGISP